MKTLLCSLLILPLTLCAKILEIKNVSQVEPYVTEDTLLIWDIDNMLMEPTQTLGSDQWFYARWDHHKKKMSDPNEALELALSEWMTVQNMTKMQLVEERAKILISKLQKRNVTMMALTTRGLGLANKAIDQLQSLGIDLSKTAPSKKELYFMNGKGIVYRKGILFSSNTHKGRALSKLFDQIGYKPKRIVYVNAKRENIVEAEQYAFKKKVPFIGLRYGHLDEKVKQLNMDIADRQLHEFLPILTDEEAQRKLDS